MSALDDVIEEHGQMIAMYNEHEDRALGELKNEQAAAELADLRDKLSMRTLENLKGQSVLEDMQSELAALKAELETLRKFYRDCQDVRAMNINKFAKADYYEAAFPETEKER